MFITLSVPSPDEVVGTLRLEPMLRAGGTIDGIRESGHGVNGRMGGRFDVRRVCIRRGERRVIFELVDSDNGCRDGGIGAQLDDKIQRKAVVRSARKGEENVLAVCAAERTRVRSASIDEESDVCGRGGKNSSDELRVDDRGCLVRSSVAENAVEGVVDRLTLLVPVRRGSGCLSARAR
jgi:hypothetical protein